MRILYIANIRLPTEKAHGVQIAKMCEAFVLQGVEVELVVPTRRTHITENPFAYYGVKKVFSIKRIFTFDWVAYGRFGFLVQTASFALSAAWHARRQRHASL